ncbi:MAG TPA: hypothetical protein VIL69_03715 [Roseomonas sp.]
MNSIEAAAELLARARGGPSLPGLPEALRPGTLQEAEAIQNATFARLGERCGGWKIGRHGEHVFSAPIPASTLITEPGDRPVTLLADRFIELELAIRFHEPVPSAAMARLRPEDLPRLASIATLFELVRSRFSPSAETGPLDRIADCVANHGAAIGVSTLPWTLGMLDAPPPVRLWQNDAVIAERTGPHVAVPVLPLIEAWIDRCRREGRGIAAGEVVTFGSLTGMPPIPAEGARYRGEIEGLAPLACTVAAV